MDWQRCIFLVGSMAALAAGLGAPAVAASFNVELLDQLPLGPPETVTDVDVAGNFAFVGRGPEGLSIVDISHPSALRVVGQFNLPGQLVVNDLQVTNGRAYLTNESYNGVAVYVLDVTDPTRPVGIGAILFPLLNSAHNLWAEGASSMSATHWFRSCSPSCRTSARTTSRCSMAFSTRRAVGAGSTCGTSATPPTPCIWLPPTRTRGRARTTIAIRCGRPKIGGMWW